MTEGYMKTDDLKFFKQNIKILRKLKGWSQRELAELLGVTTGSVSNYETGISYPGLRDFVQLCSLFDVSADAMLADRPETKSNEADKQYRWMPATAECRQMDFGALPHVIADKEMEELLGGMPLFDLGSHMHTTMPITVVDVLTDNMVPTIHVHDKLICTQPREGMEWPQHGRLYAYLLSDSVEIGRADMNVPNAGYWLLRSDNPNYTEIKIAKDKIWGVLEVKAKISFQLTGPFTKTI